MHHHHHPAHSGCYRAFLSLISMAVQKTYLLCIYLVSIKATFGNYGLTIIYLHLFIKQAIARYWCTPLTPALGRQRRKDLTEFEVSLIYPVSPKMARAMQRDPISKNQITKKLEKHLLLPNRAILKYKK